MYVPFEGLKQIADFELAPDFTPRLELRGSRVDTLAALPLRRETQC